MALLSAIDNHSENVELAAEGGAIPTLVELAKSATESTRQEAVMALARMCASSEEHLATITSAGGISADQAKQVFARKHVVVPHHATTFAPFDSTLACLSRLLLIETFLLRSLAGCKSHAPKAWSEQLLGTHPRGPCRHGRHLDEDWQAGRHKEK